MLTSLPVHCNIDFTDVQYRTRWAYICYCIAIPLTSIDGNTTLTFRNSSSKAQIILQKSYKPFKSPQGKFTLQTAYILLIHPFRYHKKLPIKAQYDFQALEDSVLEDEE